MTRQKISLLIIALGFGASVWILTRASQTIATTPSSLVAEIGAVLGQTEQKDSDGDGLFDWEESVIATNPQQADTDADGYLDGEEIIAGFSPLRQAPDDRESGRSFSQRGSPRTLSSAITRGVAGTITESLLAAMREKGRAGLKSPAELGPLLDQAVPEQLARELDNFLNPTVDPATFTIEKDSSRPARVRYFHSVAAIAGELGRQKPGAPRGEFDVIIEAIRQSRFENVTKYRALYREAEKRFLALTVPAELVPLHQELITVVRIFGATHQAVSELETDPLKTTLALEALAQARPRFERLLKLFHETSRAKPRSVQ